ncbi:MAG: hypothetical protein RL591_1477 [Planctomycetota bacterium]|jgi:hypothetical protein
MAQSSRKVLAKKKSQNSCQRPRALICCAITQVVSPSRNQPRVDSELGAIVFARGDFGDGSISRTSTLIALACRAAKADVAALNARKNGQREISDVAASIGGCAGASVVAWSANDAFAFKLGSAVGCATPDIACDSTGELSSRASLAWASSLGNWLIAMSPLEDPCTMARTHRFRVE